MKEINVVVYNSGPDFRQVGRSGVDRASSSDALRSGVRTPATPSQKIPLLYTEDLEASGGAGRTPGSLN